MRFCIDCEFIEGQVGPPARPLELVSIGIVADDGRTLYAQNELTDWHRGNPFVRAHVYPLLEDCWLDALGLPVPRALPDGFDGRVRANLGPVWGTPRQIGNRIRAFVGSDPDPVFWGETPAHDYVLLSELLGGFAAWPAGWPNRIRCVDEFAEPRLGRTIESVHSGRPHHALADAQAVMAKLIVLDTILNDQANEAVALVREVARPCGQRDTLDAAGAAIHAESA